MPKPLDADALQFDIEGRASDIATSLLTDGYYTTTSLLDSGTVQTLRSQAIALHEQSPSRYEQSWSESINEATGAVTRFDKPGVFACEPDGADYDTAPDTITYMSILISTLPGALKPHIPESIACISDQSFNAKLAFTGAQAEYPLHVDNSQGLAGGDLRKLTCILYLNPHPYQPADKGELRLLLCNDRVVDLGPSDNRFVCFWTDEIPHKVLLTGGGDSDMDDPTVDRYALTVWLADSLESNIHNPKSKFADLRHTAFASK
jgi:hypothetical protein